MTEEPKQTENQQEEPKEQPEKEAQKTFTREELGKIVKAQLAEERKQWEQEQQGKLEDAIKKAKEDGKAEATMSAKELADKQAKDREDKLKQQQAELESRTKELDHREHIAHTKDLLAEENLPTDGAEMLLGATEEDTKQNIENFKKLVSQGVRNALHKSSAGKDPQNGAPVQVEAPKKDMADMNYAEMQKYIESQQ